MPRNQKLTKVIAGRTVKVSVIEMKPATNYRNDPASDFYVRCFEGRGFFFRTSPIRTSYNGLVWKRNADSRNFEWLGCFDNYWPV
jgi:hypothetical protein